jgi:hypothetical protein
MHVRGKLLGSLEPQIKRRIFVLQQVSEERYRVYATCLDGCDKLLTLDRSLIL